MFVRSGGATLSKAGEVAAEDITDHVGVIVGVTMMGVRSGGRNMPGVQGIVGVGNRMG